MRHYEVVFLVHPDQSEQTAAMVDRYRGQIEGASGSIHRVEDWGRRQLAYPINDIHKAHYILMNIECELDTLRELESGFKFNDAILRSLVVKRDEAVTDVSPLAAEAEAEREKDRRDRERAMSRDTPAAAPAAASTEASTEASTDAAASDAPSEAAPAEASTAEAAPAAEEATADAAETVADAAEASTDSTEETS